MRITICLPNREAAPIEHLTLNEARITLGMASCPSGKADEALAWDKEKATLSALGEMKRKAMAWAVKAQSAHLSPRNLHFCMGVKFWPRVKYGLCATSERYDALVEAMHKPYYLLCPLSGVIRSAKRELRYLDTGFFGVGFPHWGAEAIVESTNKLMTHFGTQSLLGVQYQLSVELMAIELGIGPQPFSASYKKYQSRVTPCLMKEMWARMDRFNLSLEIHTLPLVPPRTGDRWFMIAIEDAGFVGKEAEMINRFRLHQQVVYESMSLKQMAGN